MKIIPQDDVIVSSINARDVCTLAVSREQGAAVDIDTGPGHE